MGAHGEELREGLLVATQREDRHGVACEHAQIVRAELVEVIAEDCHVASCGRLSVRCTQPSWSDTVMLSSGESNVRVKLAPGQE